MADSTNTGELGRWRLILGRFAEPQLGSPGGKQSSASRMDRVLDYLYGREYAGRGIRGRGTNGSKSAPGETQADARNGGSEASILSVPEWIREVRELFPNDTAEIIQRHALERYGLTELVTDPDVLRKLEPNYELLKTLLTFKGMLRGEVLELARRIVREVVEDLRRKLQKDVRQALWGRLNKQRSSRLKILRNLDWRRTIRANLKNFDPATKRIVLGSLHFSSRVEHHLPWHIIMAVDCSGSMLDSVIYSAVMAGIFKGLPAVNVSLVAFDTAVVDLSEQVDDPTELLMSVQLGGGTDIGGAVAYCESLVLMPTRTIVVLVTDFFEGSDPQLLLASIRRQSEAGVRVLGLAALDATANPVYDRELAERCVAAGAEVAAVTPHRLAQWLGTILS